jgi:DnaK suppressor protein
MPALSPSTADELRRLLDAARENVVGHIRPRLESTDEPPPVSSIAHMGQPDDVSQASEISDNEMAQLNQEQGLLRDIDSALRRLDEGVANVCGVCGQDIPDARLLAMPTAQTCVRCQERIEKQEHTPHGPSM